MESNKFIIDEIIALEWEMFHSVNNIGGRADCQDQLETFDIMRRCNLMTWPEELLCSYRADLYSAVDEGRNLMTEKYARMMEHTSPEEYESIKGFLPPVGEEAENLVEQAVSILMPWEEAMRDRYPFIAVRGRGLGESEDAGPKTSFETYLRSELKTYSVATLRLYAAHLEFLESAGENGSRKVYENMVHLYGYSGLEEANEAMSS